MIRHWDISTSRRRVLTTAGSFLAASAGHRALGAATTGAGGAQVSTEDAMWNDVVFMKDLGPRYCGNASHQKFHGFLESDLAASGLSVDHLKHSNLVLWDPIRTSINTSAGKEIAVANVCRWSAVTGPAGVS